MPELKRFVPLIYACGHDDLVEYKSRNRNQEKQGQEQEQVEIYNFPSSTNLATRTLVLPPRHEPFLRCPGCYFSWIGRIWERWYTWWYRAYDLWPERGHRRQGVASSREMHDEYSAKVDTMIKISRRVSLDGVADGLALVLAWAVLTFRALKSKVWGLGEERGQ